MNIPNRPKVAIINYGLGNLFSVKQACERNNMTGFVTFKPDEIRSSDAVILPGVGAFSAAMTVLRRLHLIDVIKEEILSGKPFIGICLGMQLLMERSYEFGECEGLGIIKGTAVNFDKPKDKSSNTLKVPQIGWNTIYGANGHGPQDPWENSPLSGLEKNEFMYFVHSYYVQPNDKEVCLSFSRYGDIEFCSSLLRKNIFACQFHPERSGPQGLKVYNALRSFIQDNIRRK